MNIGDLISSAMKKFTGWFGLDHLSYAKNLEVFIPLIVIAIIISSAATRAKARALRDFTNIGMTCLEEIRDVSEVIGDEASENGGPKRTDSGKGTSGNGKPPPGPESGNGSPTRASGKAQPSKENGRENPSPKPSTAQMRAIENLARRRNISSDALEETVQQKFGTSLSNITSSEASNLIRLLQQSA